MRRSAPKAGRRVVAASRGWCVVTAFARSPVAESGHARLTAGTLCPVAPNLLKQAFVATAPNRIWLADITYIATGEGWLYLAAVLDLVTRKIVGWSMRDHMRTELPLAAVMMAAQRQRPAEGLICHSDRGSQYASEAYGRQLAAMKAKPSMSRTACCYDNAPMESFFHTLKVELAHQRRWPTREDAGRDLFAYIEGYYNRRRIHSALGYRTPEQTERQMA
jgi:putative transposase